MYSGPRYRPREALESARQSYCSEAYESPTSQFNNGGSTGHFEGDRNQVGSEGNSSVIAKMEFCQMEGEGDRETTKEKGKWFATHAGVPAQDLEADTGRSDTARDDQTDESRSGKLDKDRRGMTPKTPSDQDQDDGVLQQATGPTPLQDETVDDDDEKNEMSTPKECKTYKKKKKKTKYTETREEAERDGCAGAGLLGARGAVGSVQDQVKDANGSLEMETVQSVYRRK
jgi:hypothetical protein